jgi:thiol-disulfide isomerase/thioredoxin
MGKLNTKTRNRSRKKTRGLSKTYKGGKKGKKGNKGNKKRTYKKPENRMKQIETMWDTIFQRNPEPEMEGMDMKREIVPINKSSKDDNKKPVIILLHAEWCGHCKTLEPEWKRMKTELDKKTTDNIIFEEIESAELDDKLPIISKTYLNDVPIEHRGFPTIGSIRDHKFEQYGGERTTDSLLKWVRGLVV